jgi:hypothetical protein
MNTDWDSRSSQARRHDTGTIKASTTSTGTFYPPGPFGPFFRHAPSASVGV